jgi:hypothetical protein
MSIVLQNYFYRFLIYLNFFILIANATARTDSSEGRIVSQENSNRKNLRLVLCWRLYYFWVSVVVSFGVGVGTPIRGKRCRSRFGTACSTDRTKSRKGRGKLRVKNKQTTSIKGYFKKENNGYYWNIVSNIISCITC